MYKIISIVSVIAVSIFLRLGGYAHENTLKEEQPNKNKQKYNILFIVVDDLRPELGCYGSDYIHSPNLDNLAAQATVFNRQYVTVPTCGASRASLLTGMLPRTATDLSNDVLALKGPVEAKQKGPESFVHHLRQNGYYTVGIGKLSHSPDGHIYKYVDPKGSKQELPHSWNEMLFDPGKWGTGWNAFFGYADGTNRNELKSEVKPYENAGVNDTDYPDGLTANLAIKKLQELAKKDQPFFLGVGFFKPHLPFNAPKKYWDLYDGATIALTPSPTLPLNTAPASLHGSSEFNTYRLGDENASLSKPVSEAYARKLRHAYYASISYVDAQIGKVLAELKQQGLDKNTIVVVWGDHGWHLGDERVWGKHTLSEWALRSPLIIKSPTGQTPSSSNKVVSSIDIYPTLMELCGVKMPHKTDGKSFALLLKDANSKRWNNVAYSYYRNGITMRTDSHRLTKYFRKQEPVLELYNYTTDPFEHINIANNQPDIVENLMSLWLKGNTGLYNKIE